MNCPHYLYDTIIPLYSEFLVKYYGLILDEWNYNRVPNDKEEFIHDITKNIALSEFVNLFKLTLFQPKHCTELFTYLLTSKTVKFGILIQLMVDLTIKKINSIVTETAYGMIKSTITQISHIKLKSIFKREILDHLFPLLFDQNLKLVDLGLISMMFTVDAHYMRERILQLNVNKIVIEKGLELTSESHYNVANLKRILKNYFSKMGYSSQSLSFMVPITTELDTQY